MSRHAIGLVALVMAGGFGWLIARDVARGVVELPRTGWRVVRRFDRVLFRTFTGVNAAFAVLGAFAGLALLA